MDPGIVTDFNNLHSGPHVICTAWKWDMNIDIDMKAPIFSFNFEVTPWHSWQNEHEDTVPRGKSSCNRSFLSLMYLWMCSKLNVRVCVCERERAVCVSVNW